MRFKIGATLAIVAMGTVVMIGQPVVAAGNGGHARHPNRQLQKLSQELNLTPEQKTQIRGILKDATAKRKAIKAGSATDKPAEIKALRKETMESIRALLTPDQIAKLKAIRKANHAAKADGATAAP